MGGHSSIVKSLLHMWLGNTWMISTKTLIGQFFGVKHRVMHDVYVDLSINQVYRAKRKSREFILGVERL